MNESYSLSGSSINVARSDSSTLKTASNLATSSISGQQNNVLDSVSTQALVVVDTPFYAKNLPLTTWDSLLFRDIASIKDIDITPKAVYFSTSNTQANTLQSTHYKDYVQNSTSFKKTEFFTSTPWFLASVFMCLILFTWLQYFFQKHIAKMFVAIFSTNQASKLFTDKNILLERVFTFLNIIYILTAGLFVFQLLKYFNVEIYNLGDLQMFLLSTLFIFALFILRFVINWLVGQLFNWKNEMKEYNYNVFLSYKVLGLVLLPIVICMAYIPEIQKNILIYLAFVLIGLFYTIRYIRGMYLLGKKGFLLFYMILYFCTIEILPLLLLYRWIFISM